MRSFVAWVRIWLVYRLDQLVGATTLVQLSLLVLLTIVLVMGWGVIAQFAGVEEVDGAWWAATRFLDSGTMAADEGTARRATALGITASGILLTSLLIAAITAKLGERIHDLRQGKGPIAVRGHILVLGHDAKVPLIARELARTHQRLTMVTLAPEEAVKQEAQLRSARLIKQSRLKTIARTGDPRSELSLLRVAADRARAIVVLAPRELDDAGALRWTLSTLLAIRRVADPSSVPRLIVEARRSMQQPLLALAGEAGLAGQAPLPMELIASDDIIARVLAQSLRHGAVYLALRELLSFSGSEVYLEPVPKELVGRSFDEAHARVQGGVVVGVRTSDGRHRLAPKSPRDATPLAADDLLVVLEEDAGVAHLGPPLPPPPVATLGIEPPQLPTTLAVLGFNRTLPCLIRELDTVMPKGSVVRLSCPTLSDPEERAVKEASQKAAHVALERIQWTEGDGRRGADPALAEADGVVILGCEDEADPDGDASAVALLLELRHERRSGRGEPIKRLVTEVRDPVVAHQIAGNADDFLVSTDVVGMMLAHAAFDVRLMPIYREILDAEGVEVYVRPRGYYVPDGPASFAQLMSGARRRGDVAIGYFPDAAHRPPAPRRSEIELGIEEIAETSLVRLNPPRETMIPDGRTSIVVLSHVHHA